MRMPSAAVPSTRVGVPGLSPRTLLSPYLARFAGVSPTGATSSIACKAPASAGVSAATASAIQSEMAGGSELPPSVRRFMEPRFGADFRDVRVHTGRRAAGLNQTLGARAFTVGNHVFFGKHQFQPESNEGRELIAHELTHTVQQGAVVQRSAEVPIAETAPAGIVQRFSVGDALRHFADQAYLIPGFRLFTIFLGLNPITMAAVDRSPANVLRALVELLPGGALITRALDSYGIIDRVATWVSQQLAALQVTGSSIRNSIDTFLESLSWTAVFRLGEVWEQAKRIVTDPVDRLLALGRGLIGGILDFVREAILRPLALLARKTPAYDLLCAVLGEDPITKDAVTLSAETVVGGFMKLIGREDVWNNLRQGGAAARAWDWCRRQLAALLGLVRQIPGLFVAALQSLGIDDIVQLPAAFAKVGAVFSGFVAGFTTWARGAVWELLEILISVVAPGVLPFLKKAADTFRLVLQNPVGFVGNLVRAGQLGFRQFAGNFLQHLKVSLIQWLTGTLGGMGIYIPKSFDVREILKLVLSVLGITVDAIRRRLLKVIPAPALDMLAKGGGVVATVVTEGPSAAWEQMKSELANLKEMVIDQIMDFVNSRIVQSAVTTLLAMLSPAGAVIQAIIATYNTIQFFRERLAQIVQVATAFLDSIGAIARGVLAAAADRVEQTMAGMLTLVISFLARIAKLGNVTEAITRLLDKVRKPVDRALDRVVDWISEVAKKVMRFGAAVGRRVAGWLGLRKAFGTKDERHALFFQVAGETAEPHVASTPAPVQQFLKGRKVPKEIDKAILTQLQLLKKLTKNTGEATDAQRKDIEACMNTIGELLAKVLAAGEEWGTKTNPSPFAYMKRDAGTYPVFFLTTLESGSRSQQSLRRYGETDGPRVYQYTPLSSRRVPGGTQELGLSSGNQVQVGKVLELGEKGERGDKVQKFKDLVRKFGFVPSENGWDVDHVVELQVGGKDAFDNLWPLPSGENRASGAKLKAAKIKIDDNREVPVAEALALKNAKGKGGLWVIITSTSGRW